MKYFVAPIIKKCLIFRQGINLAEHFMFLLESFKWLFGQKRQVFR